MFKVISSSTRKIVSSPDSAENLCRIFVLMLASVDMFGYAAIAVQLLSRIDTCDSETYILIEETCIEENRYGSL